jgi:hypothetical protein
MAVLLPLLGSSLEAFRPNRGASQAATQSFNKLLWATAHPLVKVLLKTQPIQHGWVGHVIHKAGGRSKMSKMMSRLGRQEE